MFKTTLAILMFSSLFAAGCGGQINDTTGGNVSEELNCRRNPDNPRCAQQEPEPQPEPAPPPANSCRPEVETASFDDLSDAYNYNPPRAPRTAQQVCNKAKSLADSICRARTGQGCCSVEGCDFFDAGDGYLVGNAYFRSH